MFPEMTRHTPALLLRLVLKPRQIFLAPGLDCIFARKHITRKPNPAPGRPNQDASS